jgi:hypothetical protein
MLFVSRGARPVPSMWAAVSVAACLLHAAGCEESSPTPGVASDTQVTEPPDVVSNDAGCTDGTLRPGTSTCGLNGRGSQTEVCDEGRWVEASTCVDPDVCRDDESRSGTTSCGLNGRGTFNES